MRAKLKKKEQEAKAAAAAAAKGGKGGGKGGAAAGGMSKQEARARRRWRRSARRASGSPRARRRSRGSSRCSAVTAAAPTTVQPWMVRVLPLVLPLPSAALLRRRGEGAPPAYLAAAFDALVGCAGPFLKARRPLACRALLLTLEEPEEAVEAGTELCALLRMLLDEARAALRSPLPPSGAMLLLPMLHRSLAGGWGSKDEAIAATHDAAFALLSLHCAPSPPARRRPTGHVRGGARRDGARRQVARARGGGAAAPRHVARRVVGR